MQKTKVTFEIKSRYRKKRRESTLENLFRAFGQIWKVMLASDLRHRDKAELSRMIVIVFALVAQTALLIWILTLVLNRQ